MNATKRRNRATVVRPVYLRGDVFDKLCATKGAHTYRQCAALFGLDFGSIARLRRGEVEASVGTAIHMAQTLGCSVEALFAPEATKPSDLNAAV